MQTFGKSDLPPLSISFRVAWSGECWTHRTLTFVLLEAYHEPSFSIQPFCNDSVCFPVVWRWQRLGGFLTPKLPALIGVICSWLWLTLDKNQYLQLRQMLAGERWKARSGIEMSHFCRWRRLRIVHKLGSDWVEDWPDRCIVVKIRAESASKLPVNLCAYLHLWARICEETVWITDSDHGC